MQCRKCGHKLKRNELFCTVCGYYNSENEDDIDIQKYYDKIEQQLAKGK